MQAKQPTWNHRNFSRCCCCSHDETFYFIPVSKYLTFNNQTCHWEGIVLYLLPVSPYKSSEKKHTHCPQQDWISTVHSFLLHHNPETLWMTMRVLWIRLQAACHGRAKAATQRAVPSMLAHFTGTPSILILTHLSCLPQGSQHNHWLKENPLLFGWIFNYEQKDNKNP